MLQAWRILALIGLLMLGACSDATSDSEMDAGELPTAEYGESCTADDDCLGVGAECAAARVCTADCERHDQCGCPAGTTNQDILNGACDVVCVEAHCTRPCSTSLDCAGNTDCIFGDLYGACL